MINGGCSKSPWRWGGQVGFPPSTFSAPGAGVEGDLGLGCHKDYAVCERGLGTERVRGGVLS